MDKFTHSRVLFLSGSGVPIEFCVRLCKAKAKITALIEHGNGIIRSTSGPNVIRLVDAGCKVLNASQEETVVYGQYIFDCVEQNKLLDVKDYSIKIESDVVSDINSQDDSDYGPPPRKYKTKYIANSEDKQLLKFLLENSHELHQESKCAILKQAHQKEIMSGSINTLYGRSYYIIKNIKNYGLTDSEQEIIKELFVKNKPFTKKEDVKMIEYVIRNKLHMRLKGLAIYSMMANDKLLDRTSTSMRSHFTRLVLPRLDKYNLPEQYVTLLNKGKQLLKVKKKKASSKTKKEIESTDDDIESDVSIPNFSNPSIPRAKKKYKTSILQNDPETDNELDKSQIPYAARNSNGLSSKCYKPRACKTISKKAKYSEQCLEKDVTSDIDDFSSDDDTCKNYKSNRLPTWQAKRNPQHSNSSKFCSRKFSRIQKNKVTGTNQHSQSIVKYCTTVPVHSIQNVSTKTSAALRNIVSDCASKAAVEKISISPKGVSTKVPSESATIVKEPSQEGLEIQNKSKTLTKELGPLQARDKSQHTFKFFDVEGKGCSLSFPDTLDDLIRERDQLLNDESNVEIATLDDSTITETFLIENYTEPNRLEVEESLVSIANNETEQLSVSSVVDNNSGLDLKNRNDSSLNNLKDFTVQSPDIDSSEIQPKMNVKDEEVVTGNIIDMECALDDQVDETSDMISPTAESVAEMLDLGECSQTIDNFSGRFDGSPLESSNESFFTEAISILKKMEEIIANMDASPEKNNLENNINELYFSVYRQRFKNNIRSIMKKDMLSITDKAVLLKYIAYTENKEPQDVIYDL